MKRTVLNGGTVIDVRRGRHLENAQVIIEDGVVTSVGATTPHNDSSAIGAEIIDVTGRWVLPGLIDMHCHLTLHDHAPLELFLANGVTSVRDPGGHADQQRLMRDSVESGSRLGPRLFCSGEVLDGLPPVWPGQSLLVDSLERAEAAVRHLAAQGMNCVKIYNHVSEESLTAIVDVANELHLPVIGHVPRSMSLKRAVELGLEGLEHIRITGRDFLRDDKAAEIDGLPGAERELRLWELVDVNAGWVDELIAIMVSRGVYLDPTLIVDEVVFSDGVEVQRLHPDNQYLTVDCHAEWVAKAPLEVMTRPPRLAQMGQMVLEKRREFVYKCALAGVKILAGTDGADLGKLLPGFGLHRELSTLRAIGMDGLDVLRSATSRAAEALGVPDELGAIEPNHAADLLVTRVDPLTTSLRPEGIELVMKGGELISTQSQEGPGRLGEAG